MSAAARERRERLKGKRKMNAEHALDAQLLIDRGATARHGSSQFLVVSEKLAWCSELSRAARARLVDLSFCWAADQLEMMQPLHFDLLIIDADDWPLLQKAKSDAVRRFVTETPVLIVTGSELTDRRKLFDAQTRLQPPVTWLVPRIESAERVLEKALSEL